MQLFMVMTILRRGGYFIPLACKERARGQRDPVLLLVHRYVGTIAHLSVRRAFSVADLACLAFPLYRDGARYIPL